MGGDIEVIQGVGVLGVTEVGQHLHVDVYGGDRNLCGTVRFTFADRCERSTMRRRIERWCDADTPLTFASNGSTISLMDDRALLGRAAEDRSIA